VVAVAGRPSRSSCSGWSTTSPRAGPEKHGVASTAAVLLAVLWNLRVAGMLLIAVGAICNLAAIVANGG
jgi:hypothetical protein